MKKWVPLTTLLITGAGLAFAANAGDAENGEYLYHNTEFSAELNGEMQEGLMCATCHEPDFYTRPDRKVQTLKDVSYWVGACNNNLNVQWFPEEVDDVIAYLNKKYYQFPEE